MASPFGDSAASDAAPKRSPFGDPVQPVTKPPAPPVEFPYDRPGTTYGDVLPVAKDDASGKISLAVPEMIRAPVRGAIEWGKGLTGQLPVERAQNPSPDMVSAVLAAGMRPAPGAGGKMGLPGPAPRGREQLGHAMAARDAGYVLTPAMASDDPGWIASLLGGWGGKIKTQQAASVRNQEVTNQLAAKALGLPEDTVLTESVFTDVRKEAGKSYDAVRDALPDVKPDDTFASTVAGLGGRTSQAAQFFPELMDNAAIKTLSEELGTIPSFPTPAGMELVKELRFRGTANLKAIGDPAKHALGLAQRQAADAVDALIERNIETTFGPDSNLVQQYRNARQLIAKSYDVEGATNSATGDVNARGLAKLANNGRPLTGELDVIANAANSFPKALQNPAAFGGNEAHSAIDFFTSAAALAHGNVGVAGAILGRPVGRALVLSKPIQNRMMAPKIPSPLSITGNVATRLPFLTNQEDTPWSQP